MPRRLLLARCAPLLLVVAALLPAATARALKPCPEHPCFNSDAFDAARCANAAAWIFDGRIVDVVDHREGPPLNANFAEFTVAIDAWTQGRPDDAPATVRFRVGWCTNARPVPDDRSGQFRFWGRGALNAAAPEYLWFERL